jgi:hypothetical protein
MTCRLSFLIALLLAACSPARLLAVTEPGLLYVHTARDGITTQSASGAANTTVARGDTFSAAGQVVTAPAASPLVIVLSNGSALCLPEGGRLTFTEFLQEAVADTSTDREYEPSPSSLKLTLDQGTLAIACRVFKPTSTLDIATPLAQLHCLSQSLVVIATPDQLSIAVIDGTVSLAIASTGFRETLQTGQFATLDRATLAQKYPLKLGSISLVQRHDFGNWIGMARWAAARVDFVRAAQTLRPRLVTPVQFTQGIPVEEPRYHE